METVRELIGRCLTVAGVERVVSAPVAGVTIPGPAKIIEGNPTLAALMADADGRIGPGPGASLSEAMQLHADGGIGTSRSEYLLLRISSKPGGTAEPQPVTSAADIPAAIAAAAAVANGTLPGTAVLRLELDLGAPVPDGLEPITPSAADPGPLPDIPAAARTLMLAGPGVIRAGAVEGMRAFADRAGFAVANTWGAKGLFDWQSEHHMGTAGLQSGDWDLLGFGDADLLIATGVDPDETLGDWARGTPVVTVDPAHLAPLAEAWSRPRATITPNDFMTRMAGVCGPLRTDPRFPLSPGRAVGDLRALLEGDELVAADPGIAGLWVARAFPTTVLGSIIVPSSAPPGFAAAAALAASTRTPRRPCVGVTVGPIDRTALLAIDSARRLGKALVLSVWGDPAEAGIDGPGVVVVDSLEAHAAAVRDALGRKAVRVICVPVDWNDTAQLVEVAGDVVAWPDVTTWPF